MAFKLRLGPQSVTTSTATLGAAIPTGQSAVIKQIKITQPASGDSKVVVLSIGTPATVSNTIGQFTVTGAVAVNILEMPNIPLVAGEQLSVIQTGGTTAQATIEVGLEKDASA